jgi:hypothetical protein
MNLFNVESIPTILLIHRNLDDKISFKGIRNYENVYNFIRSNVFNLKSLSNTDVILFNY